MTMHSTTIRETWRRALPTTSAIHIILLVLITLPTAVIVHWLRDGLQNRLQSHGMPMDADLVLYAEVSRIFLQRHGTHVLLLLASFFVLHSLLHPWLRMAWLLALHAPQPNLHSVRAIFREALRRYVASCMLSLLCHATSLVVLCLLLLLPWFAHLFTQGPNAQTHDVLVVVASLPALCALMLNIYLTDNAYAIAVKTPCPWHAFKQACRELSSSKKLTLFFLWRIVAGLLTLSALFSNLLPSATVALLLGQTLLLARTCARAYWLAHLSE